MTPCEVEDALGDAVSAVAACMDDSSMGASFAAAGSSLAAAVAADDDDDAPWHEGMCNSALIASSFAAGSSAAAADAATDVVALAALSWKKPLAAGSVSAAVAAVAVLRGHPWAPVEAALTPSAAGRGGCCDGGGCCGGCGRRW